MMDKRDMFYYKQSPTLFLCITNKCNLNCDFCYIHDKKDYVEPDLGDLTNAIETVKPGKLVVTGGEPMLYPNKVLGVMNYFEAEFRRQIYLMYVLMVYHLRYYHSMMVKITLSIIDMLMRRLKN